LNEEKPPVQGQGVNTHGPGIERHLAQMIAFASLDSVDELLEGTGNLYVLLYSLIPSSSSLELFSRFHGNKIRDAWTVRCLMIDT